MHRSPTIVAIAFLILRCSVVSAQTIGETIRGNLNEVKTQLAAGADVNMRSENGYTALLLAVEYDYSGATVVTYLLEKGADPNLPNPNGETPLMLAARRNNLEATTALLAHQASVDLRNQQRHAALYVAAANCTPRLLRLF